MPVPVQLNGVRFKRFRYRPQCYITITEYVAKKILTEQIAFINDFVKMSAPGLVLFVEAPSLTAGQWRLFQLAVNEACRAWLLKPQSIAFKWLCSCSDPW